MYIDCSMGAAGDMLTAALLELMPARDAAVRELNAIGIPGIEYEAFDDVKCGVSGTHVRVTYKGREELTEDLHGYEYEATHAHDGSHGHIHNHSTLADIKDIVHKLNLPDGVKQDVIGVYEIIARAESIAHNQTVNEVHFHEVGSMDAVADAAAVCYLMDILKPDAVSVSDIHVGTGYVKCAHGVLPVPAPATSNILAGLPTYGGEIEGELCTPTGAALLRYFGTEFGGSFSDIMSEAEDPKSALNNKHEEEISLGRGMGHKDFERPNCVEVCLITTRGDSIDGR